MQHAEIWACAPFSAKYKHFWIKPTPFHVIYFLEVEVHFLIARPPPFEKRGFVLMGSQKWTGVSRIWKLKGHLFRSVHLIFQGGVGLSNGEYTLLDLKRYGISKKIRLRRATFISFAYLMRQFLIFTCSGRRAFNQLLVIIVVNNFSNVKNNIFRWWNLDKPFFALLDHYSWISGGLSKFSPLRGVAKI